MNNRYDVAVIGAGIVGLAHAWMAARRGLRVIVFDRSPVAQGATVRNFGMIWPIGQPAGEPFQLALNARRLWLELHREGAVEADECGSVHLAHRSDEWDVLQEFAAGQTHPGQLLTAAEVMRRVPLASPDGLLGGYECPLELRVDPRTAAARIAGWLKQKFAVRFQFATPVVHVRHRQVHTADGDVIQAEQIHICSGSDLRTLFPATLQQSGLKLCKLQMLRSAAVSAPGHPMAHIASGLTLRHYRSFEHCSSLDQLRQRVRRETPELDRFGIHVMATQSNDGSFILGDSHEYDDDIGVFQNEQIDEWILRELRRIIQLPSWNITERWSGIYAKHPEKLIVETEPASNVFAHVGPGGAGMTLSFGLAERWWQQRG